MQNILLLHNIRSVVNVGALFRTADAIGIDKIILSGYTPTPYDRFERERSDFQKASLGSHNFVSWESISNFEDFLKSSKKQGFEIFAIEQDEKSVDYKKARLSEKNIFILGNETKGVDKDILKISDQILEIKMRGQKESLNVATTGGIVLFRLLDL